ncbi:membrane protein [Rhodovulum sulfidophilum]|uniref:YihY/virulence factor BrkB family protein n=1 Tax=Rhodovulum sulfidophilum TaxID=35806 RepID=UPI000AECD2CE|nr:YihY/virulence factor BrkB family protein [Rhodovulum sulfidophilum]MBL3573411.1 YihY/virulence factor BrkB family protein [Rhodovulum sulfidophilum]MCE8430960.1 YihY/virulence factor BrkB family protein [Rhodovulum sulfidophilum]MCF4117428.1 YihY/virulence factor BrkB family protein [Rhodovulum sulfidophilum]MCW2301676.1 membrane protein [Rhodovulum sulfidophilum]NDK34922.1 YihY/virulence factor BrkB family protein [Rhodovulum sulfidophilum]
MTAASQTSSQPGQAAIRPAQYSARDWRIAIFRVWRGMDERNVALIAAGVAFYSFLSIFPALAALIAIWGFLADPTVIQDQLSMASELLPAGAYEVVQRQVEALVGTSSSTLGWTSLVSILLAIWSARAAVAGLIRGLNAIYGEKNRGNPIVRIALAVALTAVLIFVALLAFSAVVLIPAVLAFVKLPAAIELPITLLKWVLMLGVAFLAIALVYRYGPNRRSARLQWVTPGAVFAVGAWALGSVALAAYMRSFDRLNEVYGSLGAVVALLFWLYLSAAVTLIGAALNAELELLTRCDSTTGPERAEGERGAHVADHVRDETGTLNGKAPSSEAGRGAGEASGMT